MPKALIPLDLTLDRPEDVCCGPVLSPKQFRSHVARVSFLRIILLFPPSLHPSVLLRPSLQLQQQPKVPQFESTGAGEEHVGGFEVEVGEPLRVEVVQSQQQVTQVIPCTLLTYRGRTSMRIKRVIQTDTSWRDGAPPITVR